MTAKGFEASGFRFVYRESILKVDHKLFVWHLAHKRPDEDPILNPHRLCTDGPNIYAWKQEAPLHGVTDDRSKVTCPGCLKRLAVLA